MTSEKPWSDFLCRATSWKPIIKSEKFTPLKKLHYPSLYLHPCSCIISQENEP